MKRKAYLALLAIIIVALGVQTANAGWKTALSIPSDDMFMDVDAVSEEVAYCVGMTDTPPAQGACIFGTKNGKDWNMLPFTEMSFFFGGVSFINANVGWCAGMGFPTMGPIMYKTINGGQTFTPQAMPFVFGAAILGLEFADGFNGWACGDGGSIFHTNNGGASWAQQNSGVPSEYRVVGLSFLNAQQGFACGGSFTSEGKSPYPAPYDNLLAEKEVYGGFVLKTTNGGQTWTYLAKELPYYFMNCFFLDSQNGWVVGDTNGAGNVYHTNDGGQTWETQTLPPHPNGDYWIYDVHFFNENEGWGVGGGVIAGTNVPFSAIIKTVNGGETWTLDNSWSGDHTLMACDFATPNKGWACGTELTLIVYEGSEEPGDREPPYIENRQPADGATDVPRNTDISLDVKDNKRGVNSGTIVMTVQGETVQPTLTQVANGYRVVYDPADDFAYDEVVEVTFIACDMAIPPNCMETEVYHFTIESDPGTPDTAPPYIASISPSHGQTDVPVDTDIVIRLKDDDSGLNLVTLEVTVGGVAYNYDSAGVNISGTANDSTITIDPTSDLPAGSAVEITVYVCDQAASPNCLDVTGILFNTETQAGPTPTPTPQDKDAPQIMLGGYELVQNSDQTLQVTMRAYVPDDDVQSVEIYLNGQPSGIQLLDNGFMNDYAAGDGIYGFYVPSLQKHLVESAVLLELVATDAAGNRSLTWPYLTCLAQSATAYGYDGYKADAGWELARLLAMHGQDIPRRKGAGDPQILFAGYWDTQLSYDRGGRLTILAYVQAAAGVKSVELYYLGAPSGIKLKDDGISGDFTAGDGVYGYTLSFAPFELPSFVLLLEIVAEDNAGNRSVLWPYLRW